tara:strand:- start:120 stop:776 length:657 start_codon:yes stop_codon:yes gene_type:complete
MDDYIEQVKCARTYPIDFINSSIEHKEAFIIAISQDLDEVCFANLDNYQSINEALINMSQYFVELYGYVSYDAIVNGNYFNTNSVTEIIQHIGYKGAQVKLFSNEVFKPDRLKMAEYNLESMFSLRVKCLLLPVPDVSSKPLFKTYSELWGNKLMMDYLLSYRFAKEELNIAAKIICITDLEDILDVFGEIADNPKNEYSYDSLVNLFLRFFLDFYYD